uniref:Uncharacterized protein n=1 Tax=Kalanchoe fedtschenkoi TaxID=63787 RepID=A0A7N0TAC5_KALFE
MMMGNPRRSSDSHFQSQTLNSFIHLLKKPHAFPLLLSVFLFLTWISLRLQSSSSNLSQHRLAQNWRKEDDRLANLVRFPASSSPSLILKDKRGWMVDPVQIALDAGISGGATVCTSVHLGEIRPGGMRGNHRHHTCNETFVIWGAKTKFRLENSEVPDRAYGEVVINADEVAVAGSPSGTAHALINLDPVRITYFLGCQDSIVSYNATSTDFKVWKDLQ